MSTVEQNSKPKRWLYITALVLLFVAVATVVLTMHYRSLHRHQSGLLPLLQPGPAVASTHSGSTPGEIATSNGHMVIASLSVPAADINNLPVVRGTDQATLDEGVAGAYEWSGPGETGVFAMAAHRVGAGGPFLNLNHVRIGDSISVTDATNTYTYRVTSVEVVNPDDTSVLHGSNSRSEIALITCTPITTYADRLVVKAELTR